MKRARRPSPDTEAPSPTRPERCPACGSSLPRDAITCPTCGEPVLQSERKVVSVLFADLAGYTALAEALDPEEVFGVVRPWMTDLRLIVEGHGGTVPQVMGDGFMAVFGVPTAHDDDAERAVRAALAMVSRGGTARLTAGGGGVSRPARRRQHGRGHRGAISRGIGLRDRRRHRQRRLATGWPGHRRSGHRRRLHA